MAGSPRPGVASPSGLPALYSARPSRLSWAYSGAANGGTGPRIFVQSPIIIYSMEQLNNRSDGIGEPTAQGRLGALGPALDNRSKGREGVHR